MRHVTEERSMGNHIATLTILLLLCIAATATAETLSENQVTRATRQWIQRMAPEPPSGDVRYIEPFRDGGELVAYIVHLDVGFCICGADDLLKPVYVYNPCGAFDPDIPDYQMILRQIAASSRRMRALEQRGDPDIDAAITARRMRWLDLFEPPSEAQLAEAAAAPLQVPPVKMALNMTTMWHQGRAGPASDDRYNTFNELCPILTPDTYAEPGWTLLGVEEHCIVGCAATASAQVLCYWRWPESGAGSETIFHPYRWWPSGSSASTAVAVDASQCELSSGWPWGGRLYWQKNILHMKGYWEVSLYNKAMTLYDDDWSPADIALFTDALTTLYNSAPYSPTDPYTVDLAAETYNWDLMADKWDEILSEESKDAMRLISYHAGVAVQSDYGVKGSGSGKTRMRDGHVNILRFDPDATIVGPPADTSSMISDIQWLRPVLIRGTDPSSGGHWWVVYGYDSYADLFLMNMGWGENHYHVWRDLQGDAEFEHTEYQAHIEMLAPTNVKFVGATGSGDGSPGNPYENIEEAVFGDILHGSVAAPNESILVFKAGTTNTFAVNTMIIDRPLTLRGYDVTIRKE